MHESRFWLCFFGGFVDFLFQNLSKVSYLVPVLDTGPQKNQQYQKIHIGLRSVPLRSRVKHGNGIAHFFLNWHIGILPHWLIIFYFYHNVYK